MTNLTQRNIDILKIIVEEFLQTGEVLGSKALLKKYDLGVSSATVRNDMALLEELNLIYQPYNSAGRLPTTKGLRAFINYLMQQSPSYFINERVSNFDKNDIKTLENFIYNLTKELSSKTNEIAFFVSPENSILEYNGVSNFLQNNIKSLGESIFLIIKMLEDKQNFINFIENLPLSHGVNIFIGEENIISFLKDYSIILKPINIGGKVSYIGIIGGLKMNYFFNISAVKGII
ncbi:hypothetical protein H3C61_04680 [Candidatus Gracilibacteria bacterium]|nr:hypothetical protein [Candidatus Gracilibacteria bacterium]